jgi:hypothetical protein
MPNVGGEKFAYTPEGIAAAKKKAKEQGLPMANAMERSMTDYAGSGNVGYNSIGMYKKGGKV